MAFLDALDCRNLRRRAAPRPDDLGPPLLADTRVVRPVRARGNCYLIPHPLRAARRHDSAEPGPAHVAEPGRVMEHIAGRAGVRVRPPQRCQVPQRRPGQRRGRQVFVRAIPRQRAQDAQRQDRRHRDSRPWTDPLPAQAIVAGLLDLLFERDRRRLGRAEEICREGRRRRIQEGPDRRRPLPIRLVHPGRGARRGSLRSVLAESAEREAAGLQVDSGRVHTSGRP